MKNSYRHAPWAIDMVQQNRARKQPQVDDQITIISRPNMGGGMKGEPSVVGGIDSNMEPIGVGSLEFTGYGADGKLQPDMPVDVIDTKNNGDINLHEGEFKLVKPDGKTIVLDAIQSQEILKSLEDKKLVGGMQTGGEYEEDLNVSNSDLTSNTTDTTKTPSSSLDTIGQYDSAIGTGLTNLQQTAQGGSDYARQVGGETLRDYQMSAATEIGKEKSLMGGEVGLTEEAKRARTAELERERRMGVSNIQAQLAGQQKQSAEAANTQLIQSGIQAGNYQQGVQRYENELKDADWNRALQYYDPATPEGLKYLQEMYVSKFGGQAPDLNVLTEGRNYALRKRENELTSSNIDIGAATERLKNDEWANFLKNIDLTNPEERATAQAKYVELFGGTAPGLAIIQGDQAAYIKTRDANAELAATNANTAAFRANTDEWTTFLKSVDLNDAKDFAAAQQKYLELFGEYDKDGKLVEGQWVPTLNVLKGDQAAYTRTREADVTVAEASAAEATVAPYWKAYNEASAAGDTAGMARNYALATGGTLAADGTVTGGQTLDTTVLDKAKNLANYNDVYDAIATRGMSWYDVTSLGLLDAGVEGTPQYAEAQATYNEMKKIYDTQVASGAIDTATAATNAASSRMNTLYMGGKGMDEMLSDQTLRQNIASSLGVSKDDPAVDAEIQTQFNAYLTTNKDTFAGNAETLMGDAFDNQRIADDVKGDDAIRRSIAGFLGLDANSTDPAVQSKIDEEISSRWTQVTMPEVDRIFNRQVEGGYIPEKYQDSPEWQEEYKQVIRDLQSQNVFDAEGNVIPGSDINWPWDNPDTYFNYTDWGGNDIVYEADGTISQEFYDSVIPNASGEPYKNADGEEITQRMAYDKWNQLSPADKEKYFTEGKPDTEAFMKAAFPPAPRVDGASATATSDPTVLENRYLDDKEYALALNTERDAWNSMAEYPGMPTPEHPEEGQIGPNNYSYIDETGTVKVAPKASSAFNNIWMQLSDAFGDPPGTILDADSFNTIWNEGKGYIVDENGIIQNFTEEFQTAHPELSATNKYRMADTSSLLTQNPTPEGLTARLESVAGVKGFRDAAPEEIIDGMPTEVSLDKRSLDGRMDGKDTSGFLTPEIIDSTYTALNSSGKPTLYKVIGFSTVSSGADPTLTAAEINPQDGSVIGYRIYHFTY